MINKNGYHLSSPNYMPSEVKSKYQGLSQEHGAGRAQAHPNAGYALPMKYSDRTFKHPIKAVTDLIVPCQL